MIRIYKNKDEIKVEGHAEYAPKGQDIVCAAVSALCLTLVQGIDELTTDKLEIKTRPGYMVLETKHLSEISKTLVDAFFIGVSEIERKHPEYVSVQAAD